LNGFHHEALFYGSDEEYVSGAAPEISAALAHDGAVLVAVSGAKRRLLSDALGAEAGRVRFADMEAVGRNPACIIPVWRDFLRDAGAQPVLGIGEPVWPGRSDAELVECSRHESLLNLAFDDGREWRLLCPYDTRALDPEVLAEARRNHPYIRLQGQCERSGDYGAALAWEDALPAPAADPAELPFTASDLVRVRDFATRCARRAGVGAARLGDLVLAVNELAANSLRHGGGAGVLRAWDDGDTFFCEVRDGGRIRDPLVGRARPADRRPGGRGLWIVNQLCDLVQVRSSPAGNVVRLHIAIA
jgi:anti-sigma regulatory factor (Ser/Thr protein kinase)